MLTVRKTDVALQCSCRSEGRGRVVRRVVVEVLSLAIRNNNEIKL